MDSGDALPGRLRGASDDPDRLSHGHWLCRGDHGSRRIGCSHRDVRECSAGPHAIHGRSAPVDRSSQDGIMPYLSGGGFTPALALVSLRSQDVTLIAHSGLDGEEQCRATYELWRPGITERSCCGRPSCTSMSAGTLEIQGDPLLPASIAGIGFEGHEGGALVNQAHLDEPGGSYGREVCSAERSQVQRSRRW